MPKDMTCADAAEWIVEQATTQVVVRGWLMGKRTQFVIYRGFAGKGGNDPWMGRLKYDVGLDHKDYKLAPYGPDPLDNYNPADLSLHAGDDRMTTVMNDFQYQVQPVAVSTFMVRMRQGGSHWVDCRRDNREANVHLVRVCEQLRMMYAHQDGNEQKMVRLLLSNITALLEDVEKEEGQRAMRQR